MSLFNAGRSKPNASPEMTKAKPNGSPERTNSKANASPEMTNASDTNFCVVNTSNTTTLSPDTAAKNEKKKKVSVFVLHFSCVLIMVVMVLPS